MTLTLALARQITDAALAHARAAGFRPLAVVVLDVRGSVTAAATEDGSSLNRFDVAQGKARGALAFDMGSRALEKLAKDRPHFLTGVVGLVPGMVPVPGGVLIRDADRRVLGAVGISGDISDNDEAAAVAGIEAAGLVADGG